MELIVTGPRGWTDRREVWAPLDRLRERHALPDRPLVVHNGMAKKGLDRLVDEWTEGRPCVVQVPHPADWSRGLQAGFDRNQDMVDAAVKAGAEAALAWGLPCTRNKPWCPAGLHPTHGTADCVKKARAAGLPVHFCPSGLSW